MYFTCTFAGSTCYSIYTYGSVNPNWEQKALNFFFPKGFTNKFVDHGIKYEKTAISAFQTKTSFKVVTPGIIVCKSMPWLAFSPDGVIFKGNMPDSLLEIKCPYIGKEKGADHFLGYCEFMEEKNRQAVLKTHHRYYGQIQLGMALMNLRQTYLVIYSSQSNNYLQVIVDFNETFARDLIQNNDGEPHGEENSQMNEELPQGQESQTQEQQQSVVQEEQDMPEESSRQVRKK
ncbi:hypothetical protein NQ315_014886 [Exocentrus adspersus]|uniref:YqaJ viral recombinase domain-containing protein n=1 Tax=Exocentrus adspersus TaxID=1586481 RepID=A0AAV8VKX4_9CUCU|nr:hypothetical protein NQ315_014886 [Exocentrus adspersus]